MIQFSENGRVELLKAFITAQSEMDGAKKRATNPAFKSKYADLAAICDAVMEALTKHKIGVIQSPSYDEDGLHVQTMFVHEAGGSMWDTISIKPAKTDPQGIGSALTYMRRYSLGAMCGIAPEDDDGNAAGSVLPINRSQNHVKPAEQKKPEPDYSIATIEKTFALVNDLERLDNGLKYYEGKIFPADADDLSALYEKHKARIAKISHDENPFEERAA